MAGAMTVVEFMTKEPDILVPADEKTLMQVFSLSPMEAKFLQSMLTNSWVGKDELPIVKYSIRQVIYTLRLKLEPRHIWVVNDGVGRYSIPPSSKQIVKDAIEKALTLES